MFICLSVAGHSMAKRNEDFWKRIYAGSCKFQRSHSARTAYFLLQSQPSTALHFYNKYFLQKSTRKLLAIELYGKGRVLSKEAEEGQLVITEDGLSKFKKQSEFYSPFAD